MEVAYLNSGSQYQVLNWERFNSALILEITRDTQTFTSTAVAIGKRYLLTAAHSVDQFDSGRLILGHHYKDAKEFIEIEKCIIHPAYNPGQSLFDNDLAIVVLKEDLPETIHIESVPNDLGVEKGDILDRVGFGQRNGVNLRTWSNPIFVEESFNKKTLILKDNLSVVGDSGGPVYKNIAGELKLVGIHSTLEGANKTYVVNVNSFADWINLNIY